MGVTSVTPSIDESYNCESVADMKLNKQLIGYEAETVKDYSNIKSDETYQDGEKDDGEVS